MLADYGWRIKTWNFNEEDKRKEWIKKHEKQFQIREVFVNNKLALEYKRKIIL